MVYAYWRPNFHVEAIKHFLGIWYTESEHPQTDIISGTQSLSISRLTGSRKHAEHRCYLGAVSEILGPWGRFFPKIPCFDAVILQHTPVC